MSSAASSSLIEALNKPQQEAVCHQMGPCMVIAGAGSGKTRVLTHRIAYLIEVHGVDALQILGLTFTNKAAKEMKERVGHLINRKTDSLWIGTFHSLFGRILRKEGHLLGYTSSYTIYDRDDSLALIKGVLKHFNLDPKEYKPQHILAEFSSAKQKLLTWQAYKETARPFVGRSFGYGELYEAYASDCHKANAMDFDDLLLNTYLLFSRNKDVLARYQQQFEYLLIDEFQDTNHAQYTITRMMTAPQDNLCVVGDDAQSIYSFRGADIGNILSFQQDYPKTKLIRLEQNYRSTSTITEAAGSIIACNKEQIPKKIWTKNPGGSSIQMLEGQSENEEGWLVASALFEQQHSHGIKGNELAVLYRTHSQSRAIEENLRRLRLPYVIYGGLSFYQRKEIKDLVAYLRLAVNPKDDGALLRIINFPKRGIGNTSVDELGTCADDKGYTLWQTLKERHQLLARRLQKVFTPFVTLMDELMRVASSGNAYELAHQAATISGMMKLYFEDESPEMRSRYENIQQFLGAAQSFSEEGNDEGDTSLAAFLQEITLLVDAESIEHDKESLPIQLMTIHSAKGLEFKVVFVVGLEEQLFPSSQSLRNVRAIEEERRLFYVAMTRAKERLYLCHARRRFVHGQYLDCEPSRFLYELDKRYLNKEMHLEPRRSYDEVPAFTNTQQASVGRNEGYRTRSSPSQRLRPLNENARGQKKTNLGLIEHMQPGVSVSHKLFGSGVIQELTEGKNPRVRVRFEGFGEKTLLIQYARLTILD